MATHCPNSAGANAIASHDAFSCAVHAAVWRHGPGAPSVASSGSSSRSQTCTAPSAVLVTMRVPEASYAVAVTSPRVSSAVPCTNCAFRLGGCQSGRGTRRARRREAGRESTRGSDAGRDVDGREDAPPCRPRLPSCGARADLPIEGWRRHGSARFFQVASHCHSRFFFFQAHAARRAGDSTDTLPRLLLLLLSTRGRPGARTVPLALPRRS